jgi:hypothetical protein
MLSDPLLDWRMNYRDSHLLDTMKLSMRKTQYSSTRH